MMVVFGVCGAGKTTSVKNMLQKIVKELDFDCDEEVNDEEENLHEEDEINLIRKNTMINSGMVDKIDEDENEDDEE